MGVLNRALNMVFDAMLGPLRTMGPWPGMLAVSLFAGVLILLIFKVSSRPEWIRCKKNRLLARVLELRLFKDDILVSITALGRIMTANAFYIATLLIPLAACTIPMVVMLIQVDAWFGVRPLQPGEAAVITARLPDNLPVLEQEMALKASHGIAIETDPVRIPSLNEISWRIGIKEDGNQSLVVHINKQKLTKQVTVGSYPARVAGKRVSGQFWEQLVNPSEPSIPEHVPLTSIEVLYPPCDLPIGHSHVHWLLAFLVLSVVFCFILKRPLRVEI